LEQSPSKNRVGEGIGLVSGPGALLAPNSKHCSVSYFPTSPITSKMADSRVTNNEDLKAIIRAAEIALQEAKERKKRADEEAEEKRRAEEAEAQRKAEEAAEAKRLAKEAAETQRKVKEAEEKRKADEAEAQK
jgi:hypothetical protein